MGEEVPSALRFPLPQYLEQSWGGAGQSREGSRRFRRAFGKDLNAYSGCLPLLTLVFFWPRFSCL